MALVTKLSVRTNGFSYLVQGFIKTRGRNKKRTFFLHVSPKFGTTLKELSEDQFNLYQAHNHEMTKEEISNVKLMFINEYLKTNQQAS